MELYFEEELENNGKNLTVIETTALSGATSNSTGCIENTSNANCSAKIVKINNIWTADVIQRVASIVAIMVLALVGNVIIMLVISCSNYRKRHSRVNLFIMNLAIGDLAVCVFTMTTEILFVAFGEWVLGAAACRIIPYGQAIALSSTTFILTAMSFDRFMAICRPLMFTNSNTRAKRMIFVAWLMAFLLSTPQVFIFKQVERGTTISGDVVYDCKSRGYTQDWQRKLYITISTIYIFMIPAIMISFCYINVAWVVWQQSKLFANTDSKNTSFRRCLSSKRPISNAKIKTIKMTFCIIACFLMCWTPYFVLTMMNIYSNYGIYVPKSVKAFVETIALLQSALNPIWYGVFNIKLKKSLSEIFCPPKSVNQPTTMNSWKNDLVTEILNVSDECKMNGCRRKSRLDNLPKISERSSSSSGSCERSRSLITEENVNGIRLRVRFTSPGTVRCYPDSKCPKDKYMSTSI